MRLPRLPNLTAWIDTKRRSTPGRSWEVELLDPQSPADLRRVRWLSLRPDYRVLDTLATQLDDLVETMHPGEKLSKDAHAQALHAARQGRPLASCGTYVHYPWRKEVVRVLERDDFVRLRTNRNWYKITPHEQELLGQKTIAVAGLSVGLAVLTTLALERVGGTFYIADFDELALTNLNRILAGVSDIGLPKTVIAARRILELDPYLEVRAFSEGVTRENVAAFLGNADLLVEECDDLSAKLFLREFAKEHRIPVVMQTSEGGLIDVERFDLEPERPLFHGIIGALHSRDIPALTRRERVPLVSRIIEDGLSDRSAASMLEIGTSLSTWPQLGSAVTAGAGAVVDVARRLLLGSLWQSGRFVFDPATSLRDGSALYSEAPSTDAVTATKIAAAEPETAPSHDHGMLHGSDVVGAPSVDEIRELVRLATRAPSQGNAQAWRFEWASPVLTLRLDSARGVSCLNLDQLASALALGAVTESVVLAAGLLGFTISPSPAGAVDGLDHDTARYASVRFEFGERSAAAPDPLANWLHTRCTNRNHAPSSPLTTDEQATLQAELPQHRLTWLCQSAHLERLGRVLAEGDRFRLLHPVLHEEMMAEFRLPSLPTSARNDGIETSTMNLDGADRVMQRMWARPVVAALLRGLDLGRGAFHSAKQRVEHASAALVLQTEGRSFDAFFHAGRDLLRLWLRAEARGIQVHPYGALGYLLQHEENDEVRAAALDLKLPAALVSDYRQLVPRVADTGEALLLVLHRAPRPRGTARRRPVQEVLTVVEQGVTARRFRGT